MFTCGSPYREQVFHGIHVGNIALVLSMSYDCLHIMENNDKSLHI